MGEFWKIGADVLKKFPFNRISMGVQSFKDSDLKFLNRRHDSQQAQSVVKSLLANGYNNISIDLIYGIPGQTLDQWKDNISKALSLGVTHISAYHLIYEEGTAMYKLLEKGKIKEIDEELSLDMFKTLIAELKKGGFVQYEISNFSLHGLSDIMCYRSMFGKCFQVSFRIECFDKDSYSEG